VSEIGLVFPIKSFDSDVNKLLKQYPLACFDKQQPMLHFRAVGTDEGLFVIVPETGPGSAQKIQHHKFFLPVF
jgi:hypothetical protein